VEVHHVGANDQVGCQQMVQGHAVRALRALLTQGEFDHIEYVLGQVQSLKVGDLRAVLDDPRVRLPHLRRIKGREIGYASFDEISALGGVQEFKFPDVLVGLPRHLGELDALGHLEHALVPLLLLIGRILLLLTVDYHHDFP